MLGHRGCRLGITYPEIYEMQARAIFEAALQIAKETGKRRGAGNHDPAGGDADANWKSPARLIDRVAKDVMPSSRHEARLPWSAP